MSLRSVAMGLGLLCSGCASSQPEVWLSAPSHRIDANTFAEFYTPAELDQIVRRWAAETKVNFRFDGQQAHLVVPASHEHLVTVWYGAGIGEPILMADVGFDGKIISHRIGIGVCGTVREWETIDRPTAGSLPH